jgi:hypothetical protein
MVALSDEYLRDLSHIDVLSFSSTNRQANCAALTISLQLLRFRFSPTLLL